MSSATELPTANETPTNIRRLTLYKRWGQWRLADFTANEGHELGIPLVGDGMAQIARLLAFSAAGAGWWEKHPLTFGLQGTTMIVLRLLDKDWYFASAATAVQTDGPQNQVRFSDLKGYILLADRKTVKKVEPNEPCNCVTFVAKSLNPPAAEKNTLLLGAISLVQMDEADLTDGGPPPIGTEDPGKKPNLVDFAPIRTEDTGTEDPGKKPVVVINNYAPTTILIGNDLAARAGDGGLHIKTGTPDPGANPHKPNPNNNGPDQ